MFVTKKDAILFNDAFERVVIDEIPAFIKIKALEKISTLDKSENERTYYKTTFNNKEGWVESKYLAKAKIESTNKVAIAQAEAKRFANQVKAFEGARSVYKTRMKLETFQAATKGSRKYILSDPANRDVINLELQDQLRSDLLDVTVDSQ